MRLRATKTLAEAAARVTGSRFVKPVARVVLVVGGLLGLAALGHSAGAGATASPEAPATATAPAPSAAPATARPASMPAPGSSPSTPAPPAVAAPSALAPVADPPTGGAAARGRASADDPVALNAATFEDLRRLPGVGPKRADAILALRTRLGRFRTIEDLLKVKGIGRATLRRLRPLVRIDAGRSADAADRITPDAGPRAPLSATAR